MKTHMMRIEASQVTWASVTFQVDLPDDADPADWLRTHKGELAVEVLTDLPDVGEGWSSGEARVVVVSCEGDTEPVQVEFAHVLGVQG